MLPAMVNTQSGIDWCKTMDPAAPASEERTGGRTSTGARPAAASCRRCQCGMHPRQNLDWCEAGCCVSHMLLQCPEQDPGLCCCCVCAPKQEPRLVRNRPLLVLPRCMCFRSAQGRTMIGAAARPNIQKTTSIPKIPSCQTGVSKKSINVGPSKPHM